jgi:hypothetical protein
MLLSPLRQNRGRSPVSQGASIPAPVEGWDDSSPLADMSPKRAIVLDNWFPEPSYCAVRKGFDEHSDIGPADPIESLMAYHGAAAGSDELFAVAGDTIYNVSASSGVATSITSLSSAKCQHTNFTVSGGSYLVVVNGEDAPLGFDGTSWAALTLTSSIDEDTFVHVNVFKNRLFFIPKNSTSFCYLPTDTIGGTISTYPLGGLMSLGGSIVAMGTITIDGGSGPDDQAVFITSKGQVILFQGTDPDDANAWAHVGTYSISPPIGRRCLVKIAGDLGILTTSGLLPLSKAMVVDRAAISNVALTSRIDNTMTTSARQYSANSGWQAIVYPRGNMCLVNVPISSTGTAHQYVMNTLHGAWCRFIGQNALCWEVYRDRLFFGASDGKVYEADKSSSDNGTAITADLKTAFNYYGSKGRLKAWKMVQTLIRSDGRVTPAIRLNTDFKDAIPTYIPASGVISSLKWNQFQWNLARWPANRVVSQEWQSVDETGRCAAIRIRVVAESTSETPITMEVNGFNVIYEAGGFL